ncbi:MAG: hypothetical protein LBC61_06985 [Candidatus Peribacteria bacterium]|jgi:hypothetical protein|nr:hypothetical protein [Candidatus Peribacteria bacterium]
MQEIIGEKKKKAKKIYKKNPIVWRSTYYFLYKALFKAKKGYFLIKFCKFF